MGAETLTKMSSVETSQLDLTLSFHDVLVTSDTLLDAGSDITPVDSGFLNVTNVAVNIAIVNGVPIGRALQFRVSTIAEFNGDQKLNVRIVTTLGTKLDWEYTIPVSSHLDGGSLTTLSSPDGQFDLAVDLSSYLEENSNETLAGGTTIVPNDGTILEILSQQVNTAPIIKGGITIPIGLGYQFRVRSKVLNTSEQLLNLKIVGTDGTKLDLQFKESVAPKLKAV